jgi:hypothetical protein
MIAAAIPPNELKNSNFEVIINLSNSVTFKKSLAKGI